MLIWQTNILTFVIDIIFCSICERIYNTTLDLLKTKDNFKLKGINVRAKNIQNYAILVLLHVWGLPMDLWKVHLTFHPFGGQ